MGVYSEVAKKAYLESDNLYGKHTDDYYKSKMFYGYAEVLIDAKSDSEAKYFETRAINDFDVFKTAYRERTDKKLNGIVVRPVGEANDFVVCYTDPDTKSKLFETVRIVNGKVESCTSKEVEGKEPVQELFGFGKKDPNSGVTQAKKDISDINDIKNQQEELRKKAEALKAQTAKKESTNLAIDF